MGLDASIRPGRVRQRVSRAHEAGGVAVLPALRVGSCILAARMASATVPGTGLSPIPVLRAPLVGRSHELDEIDAALARTLASGQPEIVSVLGGGGVGKTRLLDEWTARIKGRASRSRPRASPTWRATSCARP